MSDLAEPLPGVAPAAHRRPATGYALYLVAAALVALNGTVSKSFLLTGIDATRLSQLRVTFAFLISSPLVDLASRRLNQPSPARARTKHNFGLAHLRAILGEEIATVWANLKPAKEALDTAMRRANAPYLFVCGLFIAALMAIPIVNLLTPLFGTAFMVRIHARMSERRAA